MVEVNKPQKTDLPEETGAFKEESVTTVNGAHTTTGIRRWKSLGSCQTIEPVELDQHVNEIIKHAYTDYRFFPMQPDWQILQIMENAKGREELQADINRIKENILDDASRDNLNIRTRLGSDVRLISRLVAAVDLFHRAVRETGIQDLLKRRIVIVKEEKGSSCIYRSEDGDRVLTHVGSGPAWEETPTIYIGMTIFDVLEEERKQGESRSYFEIFCRILEIEERAIETGYYHLEELLPEELPLLDRFVEAIDDFVSMVVPEPSEEIKDLASSRFSPRDREQLLRLLDARTREDPLHFDYEKNERAIQILEEMASRFKSLSDSYSIREVVRILVSASGHDIHEIRNRASIALERVFSPKEYEAPLARRFINVRSNEKFSLDFRIENSGAESGYFVRIYNSVSAGEIFLNRDIDFKDYSLKKIEDNVWSAELSFTDVGQKDFVVFERNKEGYEWLNDYEYSGRVNIMPDISGEVVLEIFTDIHGHTGVYWKSDTEHPGLVYNENGQVIRIGRFSDVAAHLPDIKRRYMVSVIYLLGVQPRGSNREDWAPGASSPSPFSPLSLTRIEDYLGGEEEFRLMVDVAHSLDIKVIVDIIPHLNRYSNELPDDCAVQCYDGGGGLVYRASTDGRYGSWNDGRLYNYRMFEVWEWLAGSVVALMERFDLDGIRFDSAHAVPIMMKKNNFPYIYDNKRDHEEMVEGRIVVNDMEYGHFMTTGYYDAACRDMIAVPTHYFLMLQVERTLRKLNKNYFIYLAECYWGHERFLARSGVIPYNSALFKISENIIHGESDVRELYHVYDHYFPSSLPPGTAMLGILGNHDERRGLNTFGHRGVRAATAFTIFMSEIVMDYEGSAEGEGWKVFLDNIYVNWNQFEFAAHRSLDTFYREWYSFHRRVRGPGIMLWAGNHMVAAAIKFSGEDAWVGAFNFSDSNQHVAIQFDNPAINIPDDAYYIVEDPLYSPITTHYNYFTGRELKKSKLSTTVPYTDRVKLLSLKRISDPEQYYFKFLADSFIRLSQLGDSHAFPANFAYRQITARLGRFDTFESFTKEKLLPMKSELDQGMIELGMKRALFHAFKNDVQTGDRLLEYMDQLSENANPEMAAIGRSLKLHNERGAFVFLSAEAEPFSRSGGLGNVVFELPREMVTLGESVYVITGYYREGDDRAVAKMNDAVKKYGVKYLGFNVRFKILDADYDVGVHSCEIDGVTYYLLDHPEFFNGLYWGFTASEKLRKRIAFARASAELICTLGLKPHFVFTNDAYTGLFSGIVRSDPLYYNNVNFSRSTFLHMIHNGGWQYFDAYDRWENGFDLFSLFNTPDWKAGEFSDPVHWQRLNCMATGIRFADRVVTVSPSYASQIEHACDGLEHILHNVIGISNAIASDLLDRIYSTYEKSDFVWRNYAPVMDKIKNDTVLREKVKKLYPEILDGMDPVKLIRNTEKRNGALRLLNKLMIQHERGFDIDPDRILLTMIHRITEQKGFQLLLEASERIFRDMGAQAIIGGAVSSGDKKGEEIAHGLWLLSTHFPNQVSVNFGFQEVAIPLLSCDLFLMPSMNEPGGIAQLEAFATGALVVARATGGLRDTVAPLFIDGKDVSGNGFLFSDYNSGAFLDAMNRAIGFLRDSSSEVIFQARDNANKSVYYWDVPARKYVEELYSIKEIVRLLD